MELNFRGWSGGGSSTSEIGVEEGAQLQRLEWRMELNFRDECQSSEWDWGRKKSLKRNLKFNGEKELFDIDVSGFSPTGDSPLEGTCGEVVEIFDGNRHGERLGTDPVAGFFCGEIFHPKTFTSETNMVEIFFHVDSYDENTYFTFDSRAEQEQDLYARFGQNPEMFPHRRGISVKGTYCERVFQDCRADTCYVQSPGYPGVYLRNLRCRYHISTRAPYVRLNMRNQELSVAGQRCEDIMQCPIIPLSHTDCPYDVLHIHDGKTENDPLIGSFCGLGSMPFSVVGTGNHLLLEFRSSNAGPLLGTGFYFTVGSVRQQVERGGELTGHPCNWTFSSLGLDKSGSSHGLFTSINHWYPPGTKCYYLIEGRTNEIARLYFPSFRVSPPRAPIASADSPSLLYRVGSFAPCVESLTVYNGGSPDPSTIMKKFCDSFSQALVNHDFIASSNSLLVVFESQVGSFEGAAFDFWAHFDFFNNSHAGDLVPGTRCDEVFLERQLSFGSFTSPVNGLVFKTKEDVHCQFRFIADLTKHRRVMLELRSVAFARSSTDPSQEKCEKDCLQAKDVDRVVISDPRSSEGRPHCICLNHGRGQAPKVFFSTENHLILSLFIPGSSALKYFKDFGSGIFEGTYRYVHQYVWSGAEKKRTHGPSSRRKAIGMKGLVGTLPYEDTCGPTRFLSSPEGRLFYPLFDPASRTSPVYGGLIELNGEDVVCVWDVETSPGMSVWLDFTDLRPSSRDCNVEKLSVFIEGEEAPFITVCGNGTGQNIPIVTGERNPRNLIRVVFQTPWDSNAQFQLMWTELLANKRVSRAEALLSPSCDFQCPGNQGCIPMELVCNGVLNCPLPIGNRSRNEEHDESAERCSTGTIIPLNWWLMAGVAAVITVVALGSIMVTVFLWRAKNRHE
ncbi:unnamed protein product [Cyprideis torosa]|uniref:Uncharacterized protein n=1 Tax=Cyprideis torosa TaxID=163714 RepID=A0A7R8ZNY6_9CRUS|nr:unnamed protein product [Cyprideis torosa]CAG0888685.1 unnamed protein product [Cyprideis torosa]